MLDIDEIYLNYLLLKDEKSAETEFCAFSHLSAENKITGK